MSLKHSLQSFPRSGGGNDVILEHQDVFPMQDLEASLLSAKRTRITRYASVSLSLDEAEIRRRAAEKEVAELEAEHQLLMRDLKAIGAALDILKEAKHDK